MRYKSVGAPTTFVTHSSFTGTHGRYVKLETEDDATTVIFLKFSTDDFIISVGESSNPRGLSSVLKIKHKGTVDFELKLCQDLVGNCSSISVERLRFALCSADVRKILNTPALLERLTRQGAANLRQDAVEHPNRQRRTVGYVSTEEVVRGEI